MARVQSFARGASRQSSNMRAAVFGALAVIGAAQTIVYIDLATDGNPVTGNVNASAWV